MAVQASGFSELSSFFQPSTTSCFTVKNVMTRVNKYITKDRSNQYKERLNLIPSLAIMSIVIEPILIVSGN